MQESRIVRGSSRVKQEEREKRIVRGQDGLAGSRSAAHGIRLDGQESGERDGDSLATDAGRAYRGLPQRRTTGD